jgi:hypothetical protein
MQRSRLVLCCAVALVVGIGGLAVVWTPATGATDATPSPMAPIVQPTGVAPLYGTPVVPGTPIDVPGNQFVGVQPLVFGPGEGYPVHPHGGASMLVVSSGQFCISQIDNALSTVTVVRKQRSTTLALNTCDAIKDTCVNDPFGEGCEFLPCRDGCEVRANQSFWLDTGDMVVQSNTTRHVMFNVSPGEAVLLNVVVSTSTDQSGCAGDCF